MNYPVPTRALIAGFLLAAVAGHAAAPSPSAPAPAPAAPTPPAPPPSGPAVPLANMTATETTLFNEGATEFATVETEATGLGPLFNDVSCQACHAAPALGGASTRTVTRFGKTTNGVFDPLTSEDGTLLHARAIVPAVREVVPADANVTTLRLTIPLLGDGLIDAIPDDAIIANAATAKPFGIQGTVSYLTDLVTGDTRVGRFGWKAQHATLIDFDADALNNEIGITNRLFPKAAAPDGNEPLLAQFVSPNAPIEDQPNPQTGLAELDLLVAFTRYLAAPVAKVQSPAAVAGQKLFTSVGCAACHTPSYTTGPNASTALSNKVVPLYSDLLLHDMGSLGDGIAQASATTTQMRTAPLWGLTNRKEYLHDGRAATIAAAILAHTGEAGQVEANYTALNTTQQQDLLAFLNTL